MTYQVVVAPSALRMIAEISDRRVRQRIEDRIDELAQEPDKGGKALTDELAGYRSLSAAGQRYRIIYRVEKARVVVFVIAVGIRRAGSRSDIYALAARLLRLRLVEPPKR